MHLYLNTVFVRLYHRGFRIKELENLGYRPLQCHPTIAAVEGLADQTTSGPVWSGTQHRCRLKLTHRNGPATDGISDNFSPGTRWHVHSSLSRKNPGILANWGYVDQIMLIGYIIAYEPMRRVRNERPWIWSLLVIMTSVCRLSWLNLQDIYWNWLVAQNTFFFFFSGFHRCIVF